jgi:alpha-tubulin suppressor-like RCC1 family protein
MNLLLIDKQIPDADKFITSLNESTKYVTYDTREDTFEILNSKIQDLGVSNFENLGFVFMGEHGPFKFFVSYNSFISFDETGIKENNTTNFIKNLVTLYNIKTIDFLACNLLRDDIWKDYFDYLMNNNTGLVVRASNDKTGNLFAGGDWILESTGDDIKDLYFTNEINNWQTILDSTNFTSAILTTESINNLYICGENTDGQLGNGRNSDTTNVLSFTNKNKDDNDLIPGKKIVSIASGYQTSAILTDDATNNFYICGANDNGMTGIGISTGHTTTFTLVQGNLTGKKVIQVSCGDYHTMAITDDATNNLYVAGSNSYGQLSRGNSGAGTEVNSFTNELSEAYKTTSGQTYILQGYKVIKVSCGGQFSGAILDPTGDHTTGNLYVCGRSDYGQLGRGGYAGFSTVYNSSVFINTTVTYLNPGFTTGPKILDGKTVVDISFFNLNSSAITSEATNNLYVCGYNNFGQLGRGVQNAGNDFAYFTNLKADNTTGIMAGLKVTSVSVGSFHIAAITDESSNNLYITGRNDYGQQGNGGASSGANVTSFTKVTTGSVVGKTATQVKCGRQHTALLTSDNTLYVCGLNEHGQLGRGDYGYLTHQNTFQSQNVNAEAITTKTISQISVGFYNTIFISDEANNNIYVAGRNWTGNLGRGESNLGLEIKTYTNQKDASVAGNLMTGKKIIQIASGTSHTAIVTSEASNNLYVSGNNLYGQLGRNGGNSQANFTNIKHGGGNIIDQKVLKVACGARHTILITNEDNNNLYVTGYNLNGYLGLGNQTQLQVFTKNQHSNILGKKFIDVSCGASHSLIISNESINNLYVTGENWDGNLGIGTSGGATHQIAFRNTKIDNTTPIINKKVIKCSGGYYHSVILTNESTNNLYVAGYAGDGQLGKGTTTALSDFTQPGPFTNKKVLDVSCGERFTMALVDAVGDDATNNLYVTGANFYGQLGRGNNGNGTNVTTFTNLAVNSSPLSTEKIVSLYTGYIHALIMKENGDTCSTGYNYYGQLGFGDTTDRNTFTKLPANLLPVITKVVQYVPVVADETPPIAVGFSNLSQKMGSFLLTVQNLNIGEGNVINYPSSVDGATNEISISSHIESVEEFKQIIPNASVVFKLSPANIVFNDYISFEISLGDFREVWFKSESDQAPYKLTETDTGTGTYYEYQNDVLKIYTKHFSEVIIVPINIYCLTEGTKVLTPNGYVDIENLKTGDFVTTDDDRCVKIENLYFDEVYGSSRTYPYIITKGGIGENYPPEDIKLSKGHLIKYNDKWLMPCKLKDAKQDTSQNKIKYYHITLPNYITDNLVINGGAVVESNADGKLRHRYEYLRRILS